MPSGSTPRWGAVPLHGAWQSRIASTGRLNFAPTHAYPCLTVFDKFAILCPSQTASVRDPAGSVRCNPGVSGGWHASRERGPMKIIITLSLLLASVPAAGADTAAAFDLLRKSNRVAAEAFEGALEGPLDDDALQAVVPEILEVLDASEKNLENFEEHRKQDPQVESKAMATYCSLAKSRLHWLRPYLTDGKMEDPRRGGTMLIEGLVRAADYAQKAVIRACPAEDSLANVPGVSDLCEGWRLYESTMDILSSIRPDLNREWDGLSIGLQRRMRQASCGDGWLYISPVPNIDCNSARRNLALMEGMLAALDRDRANSLQPDLIAPPSIMEDFATTAQHYRKAKDQLCE